ncbi:disks large homolog 5-like [Peromyscus californicus insignis]|uniref:disks large homolog 5-like n=1 Tax=Peromyscus californicus insignis TaxID=564181 RepID=UPI0022A6891D|nr:disks large homolog 5-like [Peromyscus californicus insignis]
MLSCILEHMDFCLWNARIKGTTGKASTPTSLTEQEQQMNKVDKLTLQLQIMTNERNELSIILAKFTNNDLNNSILHSQLLSEWTHPKEKVSILREENRKLRGEQISLQESCEELRRLCGEAHEKIYDLWAKEKQGGREPVEALQAGHPTSPFVCALDLQETGKIGGETAIPAEAERSGHQAQGLGRKAAALLHCLPDEVGPQARREWHSVVPLYLNLCPIWISAHVHGL